MRPDSITRGMRDALRYLLDHDVMYVSNRNNGRHVASSTALQLYRKGWVQYDPAAVRTPDRIRLTREGRSVARRMSR